MQRDFHHGLLAHRRLTPTSEDGAASLAEACLTAPRGMNTCFKRYDVTLRRCVGSTT